MLFLLTGTGTWECLCVISVISEASFSCQAGLVHLKQVLIPCKTWIVLRFLPVTGGYGLVQKDANQPVTGKNKHSKLKSYGTPD